MPVQTLTDLQLVTLLSEDREDAFDELFGRYWERLFSTAYRRIQSKEATEELIQDLFTSLWMNRKKLDIRTSVSGYLTRSVKYMTLRHLKRELMKNTHLQEVRFLAPAGDRSTEQRLNLRDLQRSLDSEVRNLPVKCRLVFEMSRYSHYSNKEIASLLDISEKTVENHIGKALKILRRNLKDYIAFLTACFFWG